MTTGYSLESFGAKINVHKDTLYEWVKVHEEFSDALKKGRTKQVLAWETMGMAMVQGQESMKNGNVSAFVWMTKNMLGWRDKQDVAIGGSGGAPIQLQNMSNEEIAKRLKELSDKANGDVEGS